MTKYLEFPTWLRPEIIPGLPFRWYGLMYLVAFAITYLLFRHQVKGKGIERRPDDVLTFFFWTIMGVLIGGRLFAVFFYSPGSVYLTKPWLIFWPFQNGIFVGIQGMSYHGGFLGVLLAAIIFLKVRQYSILEWCDILAAAVPLGYTFGRLGNFINGELYGRVTTARIGMLFPRATPISTSESWAIRVANEVGVEYDASAQFINLPRHPSQLYEAFFEGLFLWLILWFVIRPLNLARGALFACYLIGYGLVRFIIEYVRQPDVALGFVIRLSRLDNPIELYVTPWNFTLGQIFCALMIVGGIIMWIVFSKRAKAVPHQ